MLVFADSPDDALDQCGEWLAKHAPGLLANEQVQEEYERLLVEEPDLTDDVRWERACEDTTVTSDGHYILSWEWSFVEDPSREELKQAIR